MCVCVCVCVCLCVCKSVSSVCESAANLVGVPVAVEDHHGVGRLQVEPQAPGACAQQEDEERRVGLVEPLQQRCAVLRLGGTCSPHTRDNRRNLTWLQILLYFSDTAL